MDSSCPYPYNAEIVVEYRVCDECGHVWRANYRRRSHADRPDCPKCYHRGEKIRAAAKRTCKEITRRLPAYQCKHCRHKWRPNLRARRPEVAGADVLPPHCPRCRHMAM